MADFDEKTKCRVVTALARFETPSEILKELTAEGIDTHLVQICRYDPTRHAYCASERWTKIFNDARDDYLKNVSVVPLANQGYRLQSLQKMHEIAMKRGNLGQAAAIARQAAEEVGGSLTNERNVNVRKPAEELTADERRAAFAELINKALAFKDPVPSQPAPKAVQ